MHPQHRMKSAIPWGIFAFLYFTVTPPAQAQLFYDVEIKGVYESNVVGLLSDKRGGTGSSSAAPSPGPGAAMMGAMMGKPGGHSPILTGSSSSTNSDSSLNLYADLGASSRVASGTALFLAGSIEHTSYSSLTQFNSTIGGLSAGLSETLGEVVSFRVALNGRIKWYQDSERDSSAYGATMLFKERLGSAVWLKEVYEYEKNGADSAFFTYTGNAGSIWAGFAPAAGTTFLLGYTHLVRDFDEPSGFRVTANTVSAGIQQKLAKEWFLDVQYDHQTSNSNEPGTSATDNIYSIGLRYSY